MPVHRRIQNAKREFWEKSKVCAICKKQIDTYDEANIDHIYPKTLGGTNARRNLQLTHQTCNSKKSDKVTVYRQDLIKPRFRGGGI